MFSNIDYLSKIIEMMPMSDGRTYRFYNSVIFTMFTYPGDQYAKLMTLMELLIKNQLEKAYDPFDVLKPSPWVTLF